MRRLLPILLIALLLTGCTLFRDRVARAGATLIERSTTASLYFLEDGVAFDSGEQVALGVGVTMNGTDLVFVSAPEGVTCELKHVDELDCRLGDVEGLVPIYFTGTNVLVVADFRREGSDVPQHVFGR